MENPWIAKSMLEKLSYRSTLGQSLKQISLRKTPMETILADIGKYRAMYVEQLLGENIIASRFKSDDSILQKHQKTLHTGGGFKQCFNDVLGFRMRLPEYPETFPDYFRVVDLRNGKQIDDGYRAIHLYYQRDSWSYPIEIQLWCGEAYAFNTWAHAHTYKYKCPQIGAQLYQLYRCGTIKTKEKFVETLSKLEG